MKGKTVVMTGGTSGIGEVAAIQLAKMGARIVLVARDKSRGDATLARLHDSAPGIAHSVHFADLSRLAEMMRVATQIAEQESRIDVLINNAGALFATRRLTEDGLQCTFALNHMAYFVMTEGFVDGDDDNPHYASGAKIGTKGKRAQQTVAPLAEKLGSSAMLNCAGPRTF